MRIKIARRWWNCRTSLGTGHYLWWGVAPKKNVFRGKILLTQPLKRQKFDYPTSVSIVKNNYPPLAKNVTKRYHSVVTHVLYHFCDMSLITACEIFCSLKFHVVCTLCTFFGNTICFVKLIKIVILIDSHNVLTNDCWHCFSVNNISVSHVLEMTIDFYYPTLELFCFSFTQPFTYSKFCSDSAELGVKGWQWGHVPL
jgi:hypothetical protein